MRRSLGIVICITMLWVFGGCGGDDPVGPTDKIPPTVVLVSPTDGAQQVAVNTVVEVRFSEAIDSTTIMASTFFLNGSVVGQISFGDSSLTFTPDTDLQYGFMYTAVATTGISDRAGNHLRQDHSWSFVTESNPATTAPLVLSTVPTNGAVGVDAQSAIGVAFDKAIDPATLDESSFYVNGVSGMVTYDDLVATFSPDNTLDYVMTYHATIDTSVHDTFGNRLATAYQWSFTTQSDPYIPEAVMGFPHHNDIVDDSTTILVLTSHPIGVTRVEFFVDGIYQAGSDDTSEPFEFAWDASNSQIGQTHTLFAQAYDVGGRTGFSDTITVTYLWEPLLGQVDANDLWETDVKMAWARSTDTVFEMRWECWENWYDPYDTFADDTTLDLAVYFDTDLNPNTGRTYFPNPDHLLNGLGADYQVIVGLHGLKAINRYSAAVDSFINVHDPDGFTYLEWPADTNVVQFGVRWSDFGSPSEVRLVGVNVFFIQAPDVFVPDWVPNEGAGYMGFTRDNRYVGQPYEPLPVAPTFNPPPLLPDRANPFSPRWKTAR